MTPDETSARSPGSGGAAGLLVALPLLYVLSIGPVAMFSMKTGWSMRGGEVLYAPVIWLHDHTILKRPLEAYVELWGVK